MTNPDTTTSVPPFDEPVSGYSRYLPAIFSTDTFLGDFLSGFETVLSGLENEIDSFAATYLDPAKTEPRFLPWLAGWVALTLRSDWDEPTQRDFIAKIVPLYRKRGTLDGLRRMLQMYLANVGDDASRDDVTILDDFDEPPHYFQVKLVLNNRDPETRRQNWEIARTIIDSEKPAHTFYGLRIEIPTLRLPFTLGDPRTSVLGTRKEEE
jgi:phage tail-like protein